MSADVASPQAALLHIDECIEAYAVGCRTRIPQFVDRHFSLEKTWRIQRPTLWLDLLLAPLNSAWAIPYLAIKKTCNGLEAIGIPAAGRVLLSLPPGIKTGYQRRVEALIGRELLEWDFAGDSLGVPQRLVDDLKKHPSFEHFSLDDERNPRRSLRAIVESFSAGRALVSNLAGSLLTIACGWLAVGNTSLGLREIAGTLAQRNAHDRAASRFVFGRRLGSAFYKVFPPAASRTETIAILVALGAAIAVGALACTIASDPLRKKLGLHQRRLSALVDNIEREMATVSRKRIKRALLSQAQVATVLCFLVLGGLVTGCLSKSPTEVPQAPAAQSPVQSAGTGQAQPAAPAAGALPALPAKALAESPLPAPQVRPAGLPKQEVSIEEQLRVQVASWKKVPYRDDGTTRSGIGNAGFVRAVVKSVFDVDLPASAGDQMHKGKLVDKESLEAGDLVFFESKGFGPFHSHSVGILLGGDVIALANKDLGVATVHLSEARWSAAYNTARRISAQSAAAPTFNVADYAADRPALLREIAKAWSGTLYQQGGTTFQGIGNDEFVRSVYEAIYDTELEGTPKQWATMGEAVARDHLQAGDIILYEAVGIGKIVNQRHAGIYIGDGEFVHSVKGAAVTISKLKDPRWSEAFRAGRRIDPDVLNRAEDAHLAAAGRRGGAGTAEAGGAGRGARRGQGYTSTGDVASVAPAHIVSDAERELRQATTPWLGTPYKIGGTTTAGIDCSAFVRAVYNDVYGVELPRTAEEQERLGTTVDRKELQAGDLVFFRTQGMGPFFKSRHVGVYLGGGEFAQASGSHGVNVASLSNRYWNKKYESARRLKKS